VGFPLCPLKYLGLLLEASYEAKSNWDSVVEKIKRLLASWKMMYLSKGGSVTPYKENPFQFTYVLHVSFPLPASVANCIEKLHRDFLWSRIGEEFKYHPISWSKVCSPIYEVGLGVRNLRMFNRALLRK
jgi:hypothetical protein